MIVNADSLSLPLSLILSLPLPLSLAHSLPPSLSLSLALSLPLSLSLCLFVSLSVRVCEREWREREWMFIVCACAFVCVCGGAKCMLSCWFTAPQRCSLCQPFSFCVWSHCSRLQWVQVGNPKGSTDCNVRSFLGFACVIHMTRQRRQVKCDRTLHIDLHQKCVNQQTLYMLWYNQINVIFVCLLPDDCKSTMKGTEFRGKTFTKTTSGTTCQRWDQDTPHKTDINFDQQKMLQLGLQGQEFWVEKLKRAKCYMNQVVPIIGLLGEGFDGIVSKNHIFRELL